MGKSIARRKRERAVMAIERMTRRMELQAILDAERKRQRVLLTRVRKGNHATR